MKKLWAWMMILVCLLGGAAPAYGLTAEEARKMEEAKEVVNRAFIARLPDYYYEYLVRKGDIGDTGYRERLYKDLEDEELEEEISSRTTLLEEKGYTQEEIEKQLTNIKLELLAEQNPADLLTYYIEGHVIPEEGSEEAEFTQAKLKVFVRLGAYEIAVRKESLPNDGREQRPFADEDDEDIELVIVLVFALLKADFGYTEEEVTELFDQILEQLLYKAPGQYPIPEEPNSMTRENINKND